MYLCYDIRGIQSFIFQIPRLKYIIGGSARVDRFDRRIVPRLAAESGWDLICAGGGKGAFRAASQEQCDSIQASIIAAVREFGADVRFGRHEVYSEAAHCTDRLFPYLPDNLKGHPCKESGLYPVEGGDVHEVVRARDWSCGEHIPRWFEEQLLESGEVELPLGLGVGPLGFMRDVDEGTPGFGVLGKRNRWAVICMDGNDMGSQFRWMTDTNRDEAAMIPWVKEVGKALDTSSRKACLAGMKRVLAAWVDTNLYVETWRRASIATMKVKPSCPLGLWSWEAMISPCSATQATPPRLCARLAAPSRSAANGWRRKLKERASSCGLPPAAASPSVRESSTVGHRCLWPPRSLTLRTCRHWQRRRGAG